jgi:uncharacterized protein YjiS (DUF1127 family)
MNIPAYTHLPANAAIRTEGLLGRLARYAMLRVRLWWQEQLALREIATLDERTLRDIGSSRAELMHHAANQRERVLMREFGGSPLR